MSTYSKNLFDVLGDGEPVRPQPVKEEQAPVEVDKKVAAKMTKDAARAAKGGNNRRQGGRSQKEGRPQRGRQFDRHSGTGLVDSDKKVKQGWGHPETAEAEAAKDVLSPSDPDAAEKEVAAPVAEPEEQVKTLDEYLAEKANKSLKVALPEARKANDADDSAFKGTVAFAKEELQEFYVSKETKTVKKTEKTRKEKVFVEIEQRFQEKSRPEFRKNDRRGGNNGRNNGRRQQSKKNSASPAVNLADSNAFPSLGASA